MATDRRDTAAKATVAATDLVKSRAANGRETIPMGEKSIATATADVRSIALAEFPHLSSDTMLNFDQVVDILHTVDVHRQKVENARADSRNNWRLVMLTQTILVWVASVMFLAAVVPALVKYSAVIPLAFDLAITYLNKLRKV